MKSHKIGSSVTLTVALLLSSMIVLAQDKPAAEKSGEDKPTETNVVEFGVRYRWGDVYGRPDLMLGPGGPAASGNPSIAPGCLGCGAPFDPLLSTSKYEEYRDLRNGFFVRKLDATLNNILGSHNYVRAQSQKTLYRDQSYLVTLGQYGKFKFQFRYDEIPHVYSNTTRTLFVPTSPGVWSFPAAIRSTLQASPSTNLPSLIAGTGTNAQQGVVTNFNFITPSITRKAGTISASYDLTSNFNLDGMYWRESQNGYRLIGLIMNSSPSADLP